MTSALPTPAGRKDLAALFSGEGVELGVAGGRFSRDILRYSRCQRLTSIDRWSDHHDLAEYAAAARMLARAGRGRCIPLRMSFSEALPLFSDASLDFIYIDGYAHTGQEDGKTLSDWWPKLKPGGLFSGHDYSDEWLPTKQAVDTFMQTHGLPLHLTWQDRPASWWTLKPGGAPLLAQPAPVARHVTLHAESPIQPGESVCLVGNGPALLGKGCGAAIDAFDQVVRFNLYAINGYEADTGSKTTLWSTFGRGSKPRDASQRPTRAIFIHGEKPSPLHESVTDCYGIPSAYYSELRQRLKCRSQRTGTALERTVPSSGLLVALWLLEVHQVPVITLAGFDHFSKKQSGQHHYWVKSSFTAPREHDGEAEAALLAEHESAGRVARL